MQKDQLGLCFEEDGIDKLDCMAIELLRLQVSRMTGKQVKCSTFCHVQGVGGLFQELRTREIENRKMRSQ